MRLVLDAGALIAYLNNESGADLVDALLMDMQNTCYVHAANICEVFYDFIRRADERTADEAIDKLKAAGLLIHSDMDEAFWKQLGRHKVALCIPLADCFCLTLAQRLDAELVTTDHQDFGKVANSGIATIRFIR